VPGGVWYEHHVISGNYRLGEFQGAVLNAQIERLDAQTRMRDANGTYLASRLEQLPGIRPQERPPSCIRHAYHLFMLRLDASAFGAPRDAVLQALQSEGIPCSGGYAIPLPDQPVFTRKAFGPYLPARSPRLDYTGRRYPVSDAVCRDAIWLEQRLLLGTREDMDDIARAFEKIHASREALAAHAARC
jgi:dTDP-4-amino-4,6-dideoxygalactose transaminase